MSKKKKRSADRGKDTSYSTLKNNGKKAKVTTKTAVKNGTSTNHGGEGKKLSRTTVIVASISLVLVIGFVVSLIAVALANREPKPVDYVNDDLSKYVYIGEDGYKNYTVSISLDEITEQSVDRKILSLLCQNKGKDSVYGNGYVQNIPITAGDVAYIYYRGYTVDENGKEVELELEGASNILDAKDDKPYPLTIGSLSFIQGIQGFEEGLCGKAPNEYAQLTLITDGTVSAGDVVYMSYTVYYPNGDAETKKSARVDLSSPTLDEDFGDGFADFVVGKEIGTNIGAKTLEADEGTIVYSNVKLDAVTRCENGADVLTLDAHFPQNYSEKSLRGLDVKFDVYIRGTNVYDTPEYNDAFITDTLKITADALSKFEGDTLTEKHRNMIREELTLENEAIKDGLVEELVRERLNSMCEVKKYPKADLDSAYEYFYSQIEYLYSLYGESYGTIDAFATTYLRLKAGSDWKKVITERAEEAVKSTLVIHYIINKEGLKPDNDEYDRLYSEMVEAELEGFIKNHGYTAELEAIKDEKIRTKRLSELRLEMVKEYGEGYFRENIYFDYGLEKIIGFATVEVK